MFSDQIGCYACICNENFDKTTIINSPNCQKVKCNIEIYYADRLMAGCIPIYYGKKYGKFNCCPIDWRCRKYFRESFLNVGNQNSLCSLLLFSADPKDELIPDDAAVQQQNTVDDSQMTCKFGALTLKVGQKIKSEKFCVECGCSKPPMMHCVQNGHC